MKEDQNNEHNQFSKAVIIENFGNGKLISDPEYLFNELSKINKKITKAFGLGEKLIIEFEDDIELDKFTHDVRAIELFGEKATFCLLDGRKHVAFILGIDKRYYLVDVNNQRYSDSFIKKQIRERIAKCTDIDVKESHNVSFKIKINKKTAKITLINEKYLAQVISKKVIPIGFDKYKICLPTFKTTKICMNCGKMGHNQYNCKNKKACVRCAEPHRYEDCKSKNERCVNCQGNHKATSFKCNKTKTKRNTIRREKGERLLRKWNIKNVMQEGKKTPQRIVWEMIDEEKNKLKKNINKKLRGKMSKEGYASFDLNNIKTKYLIKTNNKIDYNKTVNNYLNNCKTLSRSEYSINIHKENNKNDKTLVIATINIRSIINKLDIVKEFLFKNNVDILNIQETWINEGNVKYIKFRGYDMIHTKPSKRKGCGVLTLIRSNIKYSILQVKELEKDVEIITVKINKINISNIYIHPNTKCQGFSQMKKVLNNLNEFHMLTGDFNAHHKNWSQGKCNKRGELVANWFKINDMMSINGKDDVTHFNFKTKENNSPDICAINKKYIHKISSWRIGDDIGSDHLPIIIKLGININKKKVKYRTRWLYEKCDQKAFENQLKQSIEETTTYENLGKKLLEVANKTCKRIKSKEGYKGNPWWNEECGVQVKKRSRIRRKMQHNRTFETIKEYKIQNRLTRKTIRKAKKDYWIKAAENDDIINAYKKAKIYRQTNYNAQLTDEKGRVILDHKKAAEFIVSYFANVGNPINGRKVREVSSRLQCNLDEETNNKLNEPIGKEEIKSTLNQINLRKASGVDDINPFMIKFGGETIINILEKLFNYMFTNKNYPEDWNKGEIIPIPKENKNKLNVTKFRPICILSNLGKLFEKIITDRIKMVVEKNKWLPNFQNGFRTKRSTIDNLIIIQQEIHAAFKKKEFFLAVYLDVKKAYDCVNRAKLLNIIKRFGIKGNIFEYFKEFLGKRFNRVRFKNTSSDFVEFNNGMPQGSPLSPILFNLYLSDISNTISEGISQFADDLVIWETGEDIDIVCRKMNKKLFNLNKYMKSKNLTISTDKSVAVIYGRKRLKQNPNDLFIGTNKIKFANIAKYLGLYLDKRLTWSQHVKEMLNKTNNRCKQLKIMCNKFKFHQSIAITMYKGLIRPILEYGSEIWGDTCKTNKNKLKVIEQKALTMSLGVNKLAKRSEVNIEAGVLPLELRFKRKYVLTLERKKQSDLKYYIANIENKKLKGGARSSFVERAEKTLEEYNMGNSINSVSDSKILDSKLKENWDNLIRKERKENNVYLSEKVSLKYKYFSKSRTVMKIWHQARLKVLPTSDHLYKLNCSERRYCVFDNSLETNMHMLVECEGYKNRLKGENNNWSSQDRVKALLNDHMDDKTKEEITLDLISKLKKRCEEIKKIDNNDKSLVIYLNDKGEKSIYNTKYETREMRIQKFRDKRNNIEKGKEDLSKSLVPFKKVKIINKLKLQFLGIKRRRNRLIFDQNISFKKQKINIINTLVATNKKIINSRKYKSRELRIKNFRIRENVLKNHKEDLSRALVPLQVKNSFKRSRVLIICNKRFKKRKKQYKPEGKSLVVFKGKTRKNDEKKYSRENKILEYRREKYIKENPPEDLSRALVVYKFDKSRYFNKARKRKKVKRKNFNKKVKKTK